MIFTMMESCSVNVVVDWSTSAFSWPNALQRFRIVANGFAIQPRSGSAVLSLFLLPPIQLLARTNDFPRRGDVRDSSSMHQPRILPKVRFAGRVHASVPVYEIMVLNMQTLQPEAISLNTTRTTYCTVPPGKFCPTRTNGIACYNIQHGTLA